MEPVGRGEVKLNLGERGETNPDRRITKVLLNGVLINMNEGMVSSHFFSQELANIIQLHE